MSFHDVDKDLLEPCKHEYINRVVKKKVTWKIDYCWKCDIVRYVWRMIADFSNAGRVTTKKLGIKDVDYVEECLDVKKDFMERYT